MNFCLRFIVLGIYDDATIARIRDRLSQIEESGRRAIVPLLPPNITVAFSPDGSTHLRKTESCDACHIEVKARRAVDVPDGTLRESTGFAKLCRKCADEFHITSPVTLLKPGVWQITRWSIRCHHADCRYTESGIRTEQEARESLAQHLLTVHDEKSPPFDREQ